MPALVLLLPSSGSYANRSVIRTGTLHCWGVGVGMGYASMSWEFLVWKVMGLERKGAALFWNTDRSESGMG